MPHLCDAIHQEWYAFLGKLSHTWKFTRELRTAIEEKRFADAKNLRDEIKKIVDEARPHFDVAIKIRLLWKKQYVGNEDFRKEEDELNRNDPVRWMSYWGRSYDPRMIELGLSPKIPLIPWPAQQDFVNGIEECYKSRVNWLGEKSRGVGMTWLIASLFTHHWLYYEGFIGLFGSRKEELVDRKGDPNTLFWKVRESIYTLPKKMRPSTFDVKDGMNDNIMKIINPDNGSVIIGEGGDNIGAGGRASMAVIDEKALHEHQDLVDRALSQVTNCQGDISTPRGRNHFASKRFSRSVEVFTIHWWQDPSKNPDWEAADRKPAHNDWYEYQKERFAFDPVLIAQELDINYDASTESSFIPSEWVSSAVGFALPMEGVRYAGFDVAGGGSNSSVYCRRIGPVVFEPFEMRMDNEVEAAWKVVDMCDRDKVDVLNYDADGLGHSIIGLLQNAERKITFVTRPIRGGHAATEGADENGTTGKERFRNKRAQMWWNIRERFRKTFEHTTGKKLYPAEELISIPNNQRLISELSAPKMEHTTTGKMQVESKDKMRTRGVQSPDYADACVYCFDEDVAEERVIDKFSYVSDKGQFKDFQVVLGAAGDLYISVYQAKDLTTSCLACLWHGGSYRRPDGNWAPLLQVISEFESGNGLPDEIANWSAAQLNTANKPVTEWIGNEEMFDLTGKEAAYRVYRKAGISLKQNYSMDRPAGILVVNKMFGADMIWVHRQNCPQLMYQLASWQRTGGSPDESNGLAEALCQVVSRLRKRRLVHEDSITEKSYNKTYLLRPAA